jgi:HipA-like protein
MQRGIVFVNGIKAGFVERNDDEGFIFRYADEYFMDAAMPAISLSLPKNQKQYASAVLFPFFYGLLAEGINKDIQCRLLKIDEDDDFTRLLKTAGTDTIGAVTIKEE